MVCIPWFDRDDNYVNVSVGFSKYNDIVHYASNIWNQIKAGIDDGKLYLSGCGSGRLAAQRLHWEMHPEKAFSLGICVESRVLANRVKGHTRDLLDSVYILSADDNNNFLRSCISSINEKVRNSFGSMCQYNIDAFHANLRGVGQQCSFRLSVTSGRVFSFDEQDIEL